MRRIAIAVFLVALVALLHSRYPYVLQDEDARMRVLYLMLVLIFLAGGSRALKGMPMPRMLRDAGIWLAIIVLLVVGYGFRDELSRTRLMAELMPSDVQVNGDGTLSIRSSDGGHFYADGEVNGIAVRFLIDTGASGIVLAPDDARRVGIEPDGLDYSRFTATANGVGKGADVTLASLKVGSILLERVPASVNKVWMHESLLGMSFLRRLRGFRVEGNMLVLVP